MRPVAMALMLVGLLAAGCSEQNRSEAASTLAPTASDNASADPAAGASLASSCVETYSIDALTSRDYAFDGTVTSITPDAADGPDTVDFDVEEWFKGGSGASATRKGSFSSMTSVGGEERKVGDRLLVTGDDDFVWDCGFTQTHDADVAAEWRAALR